MEMQKEFLEMIENDIQKINSIVETGNDESRWDLFRELDGKYQTCIADFYKGMWQSLPEKMFFILFLLSGVLTKLLRISKW